MDVTVSVGGPDDFPAAVEIYRRSSSARLGRPVPDFRIEDVTASLHKPESWLFIARDAAEVPVAMAHAMPSREPDGEGPGPLVSGLCYLYLIFVVPERWGEGIGAQVLDHVMDDARARGFARIHLWTQEDNERSHRLYLRHGFARTGRTHAAKANPAVSVHEWARDLQE